MIYEVYGNYVEGLEKDAGKILVYFGKDFIELNGNTPLTFTQNYGESLGERLMVEAAGVEPASENIPYWRLHTCPDD
jgi:hypothetical protein